MIQSEVERLSKELEHITTVSISKESLVNILHLSNQYFIKINLMYVNNARNYGMNNNVVILL